MKTNDKKIAIMQPYLFPYLGYFALIDYTDKFIFFDDVQYIKKGWINRNRFLRADGNVAFFTVPIKNAPRETFINQIEIDYSQRWMEKINGQFSAYKRKAPYYNEVQDLMMSVFLKNKKTISEIAIESIVATCRYLGITIDYEIFSEMNMGELNVCEADDWALEITKKLSFSEYVNPPGGITFFDREKYRKNNVKLNFLKSTLPTYVQRNGHFEPGLSILDVMMFCSVKEISDMLKQNLLIN